MKKCKQHKMDDRGYCTICGHTSRYYRRKAAMAAEYRWMEAECQADDEMMGLR